QLSTHKSMIELTSTSTGVIVPVQAHAGARRNAITGVHAGRLKIAVTQAPEKGRANKALIALLAELLDLKPSQIVLLSGEASTQKKFLISGADPAWLKNRLESLAGG